LAEALGIEPDVLFESFGRSTNHVNMKQAYIDPLLLTAWQKLTPVQRNILLQIALIISQSQ
jgi:hypothetical protein